MLRVVARMSSMVLHVVTMARFAGQGLFNDVLGDVAPLGIVRPHVTIRGVIGRLVAALEGVLPHGVAVIFAHGVSYFAAR
jgi:hypothetical protein